MFFLKVNLLILCLASASLAYADLSVAKPLVMRCDLIDDDVVGATRGQEARLAVLRCLAGKIGPVHYVHHELRKMRTERQSSSFGTLLSDARARQLGGPKVLPPTGRYDSVTPGHFEEQVDQWIARVRSGDVEAGVELGATAFLDAFPKKYTLSENKIFKSFDLSSIAGSIEAKFLKGVCLYYGIGCTRDKQKAFAALQDWKVSSGTTKATRGGWIARRFSEMKAR